MQERDSEAKGEGGGLKENIVPHHRTQNLILMQ